MVKIRLFTFSFVLFVTLCAQAQKACDVYLGQQVSLDFFYLNQVFPNHRISLKTNEDIRNTLSRLDDILDKDSDNILALNAYWYTAKNMSRTSLDIKNKLVEVATSIARLEGETESNLNKLFSTYRNTKNISKILILAPKLIKLNPLNPHYKLTYIDALMESGQFSRAIVESEKSIVEFPNEIRFKELYVKANIGISKKDKSALVLSEQMLSELIQSSNPKNWYFYELLNVKLNLKKYQDVLDYVEYSGFNQVEGFKDLMKFKAYLGLRDFDNAQVSLNELIKKSPEGKFYSILQAQLKKVIRNESSMSGDTAKDLELIDDYAEGLNYSNY